MNICRFAAFLGRSKSFNSVKQYLNIIRVIHLELNLPNPLQANYMVKSVLQGMRRVKGDTQLQKEPFSPEILLKILSCLQIHSVVDAQFWAALLACFFGLMRVGSVCVKSFTNVISPHILARKDISFSARGCCLVLHGSKTIQFQQRIHTVTLPFFKDHPLCPATAILRFLDLAGDLPNSFPGFSYKLENSLHILTVNFFRTRLQSVLKELKLCTKMYNTHSLRRGGGTWLLSAGVPLHLIKILGDWKSDCVFKYLQPDNSSKFNLLQGLKPALPNFIH